MPLRVSKYERRQSRSLRGYHYASILRGAYCTGCAKDQCYPSLDSALRDRHDEMVAAQWSAPDILAHARKSGGLAADERHRRTCVGCSRADVVGREAEVEQRRQVVPHCQLHTNS